MTYVFQHRVDGRLLVVVGRGSFPLIDATRQLRDLAGYPDDWDVRLSEVRLVG